MNTMPSSSPSLDDLRARIDEIDDRLHDLLMERTQIVEAIGGVKRNGQVPPLRPGREASIIRRLVARHKGAFPKGVLVRMWRELLGGTVAVQGRFAVAVFAPSAGAGFWDLARDHFGSHTSLSGYRSIGQVIRAVTDGQAVIGVLPLPQEGEASPWWPFLASTDETTPRVVARLPFGGRGNARADGGDALAIGIIAPEATGADRTLLAVETGGDISRARIFATLAQCGMPCTAYASHERSPGFALSLIEFDGYAEPGDARLTQFTEQLGGSVERIIRIGSYALPLGEAELAVDARP
jgi:chorismate mutase / prephenate dehydratase